MRILFITGGLPTPIGQNHILHLLKVLCRTHQVTTIAFDLGDKFPFLKGWEKEREGLGEIVAIPLPEYPVWSRLLHTLATFTPFAIHRFRAEAMKREVEQRVPLIRPDVVVFEQLGLAQYVPLVGAVAKILFPVDAVSRYKWQQFQIQKNPLHRLAWWGDYWLTRRYEKHIYRCFDGIMFVSDVDGKYSVANRLCDPDQVYILPLAIDSSYFRPATANDTALTEEPSLVFVGNMFNPINTDAMVWFYHEVWRELRQLRANLRLYIVGSDPGLEIQQLAAEDPRVVVTGYVKDFRPYVWGASIFICPLRFGTGIKNRILQALAMGKATVASPLSIEGLDLQAGTQLWLAEDAGQFRERILFLLDHGAERERLGREARRYVEPNHSLEANADRFLQIVGRVFGTQAAAVSDTAAVTKS